MTVPAHGPASPSAVVPRPGPPAPRPEDPDALAALRAAVDALPDASPATADFDAADHAARFEAVHDALVAVLADVDGT